MQLITIPELTPAQSQLATVQDETNNLLNSLREITVRSFRQFWFGPIPTESLLLALGTNAAAAFNLHATSVAFLAANGYTIPESDAIPPIVRPYTLHPDGTITLN